MAKVAIFLGSKFLLILLSVINELTVEHNSISTQIHGHVDKQWNIEPCVQSPITSTRSPQPLYVNPTTTPLVNVS